MHPDLLKKTVDGIFCEEGNFYIDPWGATPIVLITHAHIAFIAYDLSSTYKSGRVRGEWWKYKVELWTQGAMP